MKGEIKKLLKSFLLAVIVFVGLLILVTILLLLDRISQHIVTIIGIIGMISIFTLCIYYMEG